MKRTRRNGPGVPVLTPAEALDMLASAVNYCQSAGLRVKAGNVSPLGLVLAFSGARMSADVFGVMRFEPCAEVADTYTADEPTHRRSKHATGN